MADWGDKEDWSKPGDYTDTNNETKAIIYSSDKKKKVKAVSFGAPCSIGKDTFVDATSTLSDGCKILHGTKIINHSHLIATDTGSYCTVDESEISNSEIDNNIKIERSGVSNTKMLRGGSLLECSVDNSRLDVSIIAMFSKIEDSIIKGNIDNVDKLNFKGMIRIVNCNIKNAYMQECGGLIQGFDIEGYKSNDGERSVVFVKQDKKTLPWGSIYELISDTPIESPNKSSIKGIVTIYNDLRAYGTIIIRTNHKRTIEEDLNNRDKNSNEIIIRNHTVLKGDILIETDGNKSTELHRCGLDGYAHIISSRLVDTTLKDQFSYDIGYTESSLKVISSSLISVVISGKEINIDRSMLEKTKINVHCNIVRSTLLDCTVGHTISSAVRPIEIINATVEGLIIQNEVKIYGGTWNQDTLGSKHIPYGEWDAPGVPHVQKSNPTNKNLNKIKRRNDG